MMLGTTVSPWLGGVITERFGWHAPFLMLLVLALLVTLAVWRLLPETHVKGDKDMSFGQLGRSMGMVLRKPMFVVGTERDHVAPWHSVHKIHMLSTAEITFVLTSGGHNAGIVSEPGHKGRRYHILTREADAAALDPDDWVIRAPVRDGSWWVAWGEWLGERSGEPTAPPAMGAPDKGYPVLEDAPGRFVLEH